MKQEGDIVCQIYLYPSWHQAVCSSEDDLLCVAGLWWGQDNLACPWTVSRCQDELLLWTTGRVNRCHNLDLLTCLLVGYNLKSPGMEEADIKQREVVEDTNVVKVRTNNNIGICSMLFQYFWEEQHCSLPVLAVVLWQAQRRWPESAGETHPSLDLMESTTPNPVKHKLFLSASERQDRY